MNYSKHIQNRPYWYTYCLNNPLRFTDPSGYYYEPQDPKGVAPGRGGGANYQYLYYGGSRGAVSNGGWDFSHFDFVYNSSMGSNGIEIGTTWGDVVNRSWTYAWGTGQYVNTASNTMMSASDFGAYILPSMGTRLSEGDMAKVLNGSRSLSSQTQSSSGGR